jgi:hypothetical protein
MARVFEHADNVFKLLGTLVRRPRKGELPEDAKGRHGLPVVRLIGDEQGDLIEDLEAALGGATPAPVLHELVDVAELWTQVRQDPDQNLPDDWQPIELYRRVLVNLAQEFSSARNGRDRRVRFRRFGLVNWLLQTEYADQEPDPQDDRELLRGLREREFRRRRFFGVLRGPETEVAMGSGQIPWYLVLVGLHVFPIVWFRAWRGVGVEYRWLLRQPYMAPRDPGTFVGFAMRLTQPRWYRENPEQAGKLMINAFLEDLRSAYRRRPWRRRAARRTAYCVALLRGASAENHGKELVRSVIDVRNDTGAFDPLLVVDVSAPTGGERPGQGRLSEDLYGIWRNDFRDAGRSRTADVWYLPVAVPAPLTEHDEDYALHRDRLRLANRLTVEPPPRWARRRVAAVAAALAMVLLVTGLGFSWEGYRSWEESHCGLSHTHPDASTLQRRSSGECVGVAPHGYAFGSSDPDVKKTLTTIADQNEEADTLHRDHPRRPVVTLVHLSALLSTSGGGDSPLAYAREQLQGAASAQRKQLDKDGESDPVLRIFPASAGSGMRYGPDVVRTLEAMKQSDPSIVGVTGLDQSRRRTITTIRELTRIGLPMVATTPSADFFDDHSPMYYQVSPQNQREAAVAAAYARHLADEGKLEKRKVRVVYSADPTDIYSDNLSDDVVGAFRGADFDVKREPFNPGTKPIEGGSGLTGAQTVGERACGYDGLVFYAGRAEEFEGVLSGTNAACGTSPPAFLAGDDVARLAADPKRRGAYPRVPFDFLDFTLGASSCDSESDLYSTMRRLFEEECKPRRVANTSLDGHAALAFDAVNLYVKAVGRLRESAPSMPLTAPAVWHALSSIHGKSALDGESGEIDYGGKVDRQVPLDKLISVQHVDGSKRPEQAGFCGRVGVKRQSKWCPAPE